MAEELTTNVVQEERVAFDDNCNIRKSDIVVEEDPDVSLRGILNTAFTSTVDSQDNGVFERTEMADDGLFSESDIDSDSNLFHPSTSFEDTRNTGSSYTNSSSAFHDSYFLDHNYVSEISSGSSSKRKRSPIDNEMSFSSRLRTKKNISIPDIENSNVYNTQRCFNSHRRYPSGTIQNPLPLSHARRTQQGIPIPSVGSELDATYSAMNPSEISTANVECILPESLSYFQSINKISEEIEIKADMDIKERNSGSENNKYEGTKF